MGYVDVRQLTFARSTGERTTVKGREAWTLLELLEAGPTGVSVIERPAPRWSCYVHRLRRRGLAIETIRESHSGPYAGTHGRYVLRDAIELVGIVTLKEAGHAEHR